MVHRSDRRRQALAEGRCDDLTSPAYSGARVAVDAVSRAALGDTP